jgi:hypothetical protein
MSMKLIYVFANGADYVSIDGVCYKKTSNVGTNNVDSSKVVVHQSAEDCKKAK